MLDNFFFLCNKTSLSFNFFFHVKDERWRKNYGTPTKTTGNPKSNANSKARKDGQFLAMNVGRKKKFLLPWWCAYIGWLLVIASVGCSIFFLWAYGLQFGNERTEKWLTSLVISFFSSVLLTEPIKVSLK